MALKILAGLFVNLSQKQIKNWGQKNENWKPTGPEWQVFAFAQNTKERTNK